MSALSDVNVAAVTCSSDANGHAPFSKRGGGAPARHALVEEEVALQAQLRAWQAEMRTEHARRVAQAKKGRTQNKCPDGVRPTIQATHIQQGHNVAITLFDHTVDSSASCDSARASITALSRDGAATSSDALLGDNEMEQQDGFYTSSYSLAEPPPTSVHAYREQLDAMQQANPSAWHERSPHFAAATVHHPARAVQARGVTMYKSRSVLREYINGTQQARSHKSTLRGAPVRCEEVPQVRRVTRSGSGVAAVRRSVSSSLRAEAAMRQGANRTHASVTGRLPRATTTATAASCSFMSVQNRPTTLAGHANKAPPSRTPAAHVTRRCIDPARTSASVVATGATQRVLGHGDGRPTRMRGVSNGSQRIARAIPAEERNDYDHVKKRPVHSVVSALSARRASPMRIPLCAAHRDPSDRVAAARTRSSPCTGQDGGAARWADRRHDADTTRRMQWTISSTRPTVPSAREWRRTHLAEQRPGHEGTALRAWGTCPLHDMRAWQGESSRAGSDTSADAFAFNTKSAASQARQERSCVVRSPPSTMDRAMPNRSKFCPLLRYSSGTSISSSRAHHASTVEKEETSSMDKSRNVWTGRGAVVSRWVSSSPSARHGRYTDPMAHRTVAAAVERSAVIMAQSTVDSTAVAAAVVRVRDRAEVTSTDDRAPLFEPSMSFRLPPRHCIDCPLLRFRCSGGVVWHATRPHPRHRRGCLPQRCSLRVCRGRKVRLTR